MVRGGALVINTQGTQGKKPNGEETIEMYSYTINLVEMADTAEGGELQWASQDLQSDVGAGM